MRRRCPIRHALTWAMVWGMCLLAPGAGADETGLQLTLGTTAFRENLERWNPALEKWPDVRLKFEQPEEISFSLLDQEPRVRGIEVRFPMSLLWVGYEWSAEGDEPKATFSIQHRF